MTVASPTARPHGGFHQHGADRSPATRQCSILIWPVIRPAMARWKKRVNGGPARSLRPEFLKPPGMNRHLPTVLAPIELRQNRCAAVERLAVSAFEGASWALS